MRPRLLALASAAALVATTAAGAHLHPTKRIGGDKYRNTTSQHATNVEPDSFAFGNTIVTTAQTGRFFDGGGSNTVWATSNDGGQSWVKGNLPGTTVFATPPGPWDRVSDPVVAYDSRRDVWMISTLAISQNSGRAVLVSRSEDGGRTWGNPVTVASTPNTFFDKNWIACDTWPDSPYYGNCYVQWDDYGQGNTMMMSTSIDGGLTWSPIARPPVPRGLGGQPVVQPDGTVVVTYTANYGGIYAYRSEDGGATWTSAVLVSTQSTHNVAGSLRDPPLPSSEVDSSGRVFVAWHGCQFRSGCSANDIIISSSTDGLTWTPATRIPISPANGTVDHFLPGIGVDPVGPPGRIGVVYYFYPQTSCTFSTCQLTPGFISSGDSGATWHQPVTLAPPIDLSWIPNTSQGRMVGDYFSTSFVGHEAHPVFVTARAPVPPAGRFEALMAEAGIAVPTGAGPRRAIGVRPKTRRPARGVILKRGFRPRAN